jgi:ActR/RegA family two-component response regulator
MGLSCLLLTSDSKLLEVMRVGFDSAGVDLELRTDVPSALELTSRRHIDSFVIDCDDVPGARNMVEQIRNSRSNHFSVIFAVVNATTTPTEAAKSGANFVLNKPVTDGLLRGFLDIATARMEREHRRYFRHEAANLPIKISCETGETFAGKIKNLSEGGLAISLFGRSSVNGVVTVDFELPSAEPQPFKAHAEIVWKDNYAMGLRFIRIQRQCRSNFTAWLDSLEARLNFHQSQNG